VIGDNIGRGAAENDGRAGEGGQGDGRVAGVVVGWRHRWRLLVAGVVLLVDDDDAQVGQRREEGAARTDGDVEKALSRPPPGVISFAVA